MTMALLRPHEEVVWAQRDTPYVILRAPYLSSLSEAKDLPA